MAEPLATSLVYMDKEKTIPVAMTEDATFKEL